MNLPRKRERIVTPPCSAKVAGRRANVWPMIAAMDYLLRDLGTISPMTAHLLRMARQNLLDEYLTNQRTPGDEAPDELP